MTTTDTSASTSAQGYHDSLIKATRAVINASRTVKKQIADPKNVGLTTRITFLDGMEKAVLKQVQETSATLAGLELAIRLLEGYQSFTKEDYLYVSSLGQQFAPVEEKKLLDAHTKLSEQIIEVQKFLVNSTKQSQVVIPADASKVSGQPASQFSTPGQASQPTITNLFLALLSSADVQLLLPTNINGEKVVSQTKDLLDRRTPKPPLSDTALSNLIESWKIAMDFFTGKQFPEDPDNPHPDLASIAGLIEIHAQLEVLYEQLITISEETGVASLLSLY